MFLRELSFKTCAQEYHRCTAELVANTVDICLRQRIGSWPRDVCRHSALSCRTGLLYAKTYCLPVDCYVRCGAKQITNHVVFLGLAVGQNTFLARAGVRQK